MEVTCYATGASSSYPIFPNPTRHVNETNATQPEVERNAPYIGIPLNSRALVESSLRDSQIAT